MAGDFGFSIEGLEELKQLADWKYLVVTPSKVFMKAAGAAMRQAAQREAPKGRTKKLSRSHVEVYGPGDIPAFVRIENTDQPKATWVAFGTRPHLITPNAKKALFWPGARHPVRSVNHPGTKPNDWMTRALKVAQTEIDGPIASAWNADIEARWNRKSG